MTQPVTSPRGVDVLEVMDQSAKFIDSLAPKFKSELHEARTAVAELIEAAEGARQLLEMVAMISPFDEPQEGSVGHKLRAALAKATGAAP